MQTKDLEFIELSKSKVSDEAINNFDCGNEDMTEYLHNNARNDAITGAGVTYVLVTADRERIYAYATIRAYGLYYYDDALKYHIKSAKEGDRILLSIPSVEIKMFAISKKLKGVVAYGLDPVNQQHYSSVFFKIFLEDLYYMSMGVIGFKMVFLRANDEGERLYRNNNFVDCEEYLSSYDTMSEGCKPLAITLNKIEKTILKI